MKWCSAVAVCWLFLAGPAFGQGPDLERAKESFRAGASAYAAGDYLAAIQALDLAYEITPLPAIAFSLAQAQRKQYFRDHQVQHLQRALTLFRRYVEQEPQGARLEDANLAIAQLEPLLAARAPALAAAAPAPAPAPGPRPTRIMIVSDAPGAQISLDGSELAPSPLIREVTPGSHHASVRAPGFFSSERSVTAVSGELILSEVRLSEKTASLYVWAPNGADVYVDGVFVGQGGQHRLVLELPSGRHQLAVAKNGYELERRDLSLARGQTHGEWVALEPTTQRRVARGMFIGSAGTLSAGIVLAALAIRSENQAEDFLSSTGDSTGSSAELASYNAAISDRNRYRAAAAAGFVGASALLITGLFLHELDRPNLPAPASREWAPAPASAPRVSLLPEARGSDVGGSLRLEF
jgi:hypothetical protein